MENQSESKAQLMSELEALRREVAQLREQIASSEQKWPAGEQLRQVVHSISDHIYVTEITGEGVWLNRYISPQIENLTGYSPEVFLTDWTLWSSQVIHPEDQAAAAAQAARLAEGYEGELEYRLIRADGQIIWIRDSAKVEPLQESKFVYGVVADVTERRQREAALPRLLELSRTLVTIHNPNLVLDQAIKLAVEIAPAADRGSLQLLEEDGKTLQTVAISDPDENLQQVLVFRPGVGIAGHALSENQTINVPDVLKDERFLPGNLELRFRSLLVAPLVVKGRLMGTLSLSSRQVGAFSTADQTLVQLIADQVAAALENARLFTSYLQAEKLRKIQQFLQSIIDALAARIAILDEVGRIVAVNAHWRQAITDNERDSNYALGTNYLEFCQTNAGPYGSEGVLVSEGIRQVMNHQRDQFYLEYSDPHPVEKRWYGVRVTRFESEGAARVVVAHEDVTERKTAEEALRASENRFRSLVQNSSDIIALLDARRQIQYVSPPVERILGYQAGDLIGKKVIDYIHPQDKVIARVGFSTVDHSLEARGRPIEFRIRHANGSWRWLEAVGNNFLDDPNVAGIVVNARDISNRKRVEEKLHLLAAAIGGTEEGVLITEVQPDAASSKIVFVNRSLCRMTGFSQEELMGQTPRLFQGPKTDPTIFRQLEGGLVPSQSFSVETINYRRDATEYHAAWHISPVLDELGQISHYVSIQRDITEFKQLEAQFLQAQKMEAVGQLAGGVAHDFNNLLTITKGYSELILMKLKGEDPLRRDVEEIKKASEQASLLTHQLLIFSRRELMQPKLLDLNYIVANLEKMLHRLLGEDVYLTTSLDTTPCMVRADPGQMEQVIMNLAINARDAMPQGGQLTIKTDKISLDQAYSFQSTSLPAGRYTRIIVSDTGTGIDEDILTHIFEPFYTTKERGKGTGLGLSTVYAIVNRSQGNIQVFSEPGQGTTFTVYIPYANGTHRDDQVTGEEGALLNAYRGIETILLVEDEEGVRRFAHQVLVDHGYTVLEAQYGSEALQTCLDYQGPIHLLLTDIVMPKGMSGRMLAQKVRSLTPEIKVLYTSGYIDDVIARHGVLEPNAPFLQKPFNPHDLLEKVREVLNS
jgi:PAS domain S-box-containing protein